MDALSDNDGVEGQLDGQRFGRWQEGSSGDHDEAPAAQPLRVQLENYRPDPP